MDQDQRKEQAFRHNDILSQVDAAISLTRERVRETKAVLRQSQTLMEKSRELAAKPFLVSSIVLEENGR
jgi:hypothetical protein